MASPMRNTSRSYSYDPPIADMVLEAYSRIQIRGPELRVEHMIEARRSANLLLKIWENRGVNQWAVGDQQIVIPMEPGIATYALPTETINVLDSYRRVYQPNATFTTLGAGLTAMLANGQPIIRANGDPGVLGPGSGTLSTVAGSQEVGLRWPSHGLSVGSPLFWNIPASVGGLVLDNFNVVDQVIDQNNVTFTSNTPALWTSALQGATPLFAVTIGLGLVDVILPRHGLSVGSTFAVQVATTVGGITIPAGTYNVVAVPSINDFIILPGGGVITYLTDDNGVILTDDQGNPLIASAGDGPPATSNDAIFENNGQIEVTSQSPGTNWVDIFLWPISRDDYAMLPVKETQGPPTQYWFNRTINPSITVWPVPPSTLPPNFHIAFVAYRMRKVQDANPVGGQVLDLPDRFLPAFASGLTAAVAEKYKPDLHMAKLTLAAADWAEAAAEDREKVSSYIVGDFSGYFR